MVGLHARRSRLAAITGIAFAALLANAGVAGATLKSYTWSGRGPAPGQWSVGANWVGGVPPAPISATSTHVQALTFPVLAGCTGACYESTNNLTGLQADKVTVAGNYALLGNRLTLGAAGDAASGLAASSQFLTRQPIALGTGQTWTFSHATNSGQGYQFFSPITGPGAALKLVQAGADDPWLVSGNDEVGPVTIAATASAPSYAPLLIGGAGPATVLNAADGHPINVLDGVSVVGFDADTGPLSTTASTRPSELQVGQPGSPTGAWAVHGTVAIGANTDTQIFIAAPGTSVGTDYSQLSASGTVALAGTLFLAAGGSSCPALTVGQAYPIVKAVGAVSGTFSNAPSGIIIDICSTFNQPVRIGYTTHAVTATVLRPTPGCRFVSASTPANTPVAIQLSCTDPTGQPLTYSIASTPGHGRLSAISATHSVTYTPNSGFTGSDSFTYRARSSTWGSSPPEPVFINVGAGSVAARRLGPPSTVLRGGRPAVVLARR
jgi:hypothetical protein